MDLPKPTAEDDGIDDNITADEFFDDFFADDDD